MHDNTLFSDMNTTEDVVNILSKLSFNVDNFEKVYYNMYISETPMDIIFKQYNSDGAIKELTIPNVAKMKTTAYTSNGDPNGVIFAPQGSFCVDLTNGTPYYKMDTSDSFGWTMLWTVETLGDQKASVDNTYLAPDGDAASLTNFNVSSIKEGCNPLPVNRGGTGTNSLDGIVKANGTNPYSRAVDGVEYLGPDSTTGIIYFYPPLFGSDSKLVIPNGWLICDGSSYNKNAYSNLFNIIGYTYGGSGTSFNVPNLLNYFIRCINSIVQGTCRAANDIQQSQNRTHAHDGSSYTVNNANAPHEHTASCNTTGNHLHGSIGENAIQEVYEWGWYNGLSVFTGTYGDVDEDNTYWNTSTNGAHSHNISIGTTNTPHTHVISGDPAYSGGDEFNVQNLPFVPIIKF